MKNSASTFKNIEPITRFSDITSEITLNTPVIVSLQKVIKYNEQQKFLVAILIDDANEQMLAFFYNEMSELLANPRTMTRFPMKITIFKGKLKQSGQKPYLEAYHVIIENNTYINSNSIGSYHYCEMQTYLQVYIHYFQSYNKYLLWGNLFHDYLASFYMQFSPSLSSDLDTLEKLILHDFELACYQNWQLFVVLGKQISSIVKEFKQNFLANEIEFALQELEFYGKEYQNFKFECETMLYSRFFGIQGRIDRYIHDIPLQKYKIYETKTGQSPRSSQLTAYYQSMAYAIMLQETQNAELQGLVIEYPRLPVSQRLIPYEFEHAEFLKVLNIRNKIWSLLIGNQPPRLYSHPCSRCGSRDACNFYEYLAHFDEKDYDFSHNYYAEHFTKDDAHKRIFSKVSAYYTWFSALLNREFLRNLNLINELHLSAEIREKKGNAISNLELDLKKTFWNTIQIHTDVENQEELLEILKDSEATPIKQIWLKKKKSGTLGSSRLRSGDRVIVSLNEESPFSSNSMYGTVKEMYEDAILIQLYDSLEWNIDDFQEMSFRVDSSTSNSLVYRQKQFLDYFLRYSRSNTYENVKNLRNILLFEKSMKLTSVSPELIAFPNQTSFDTSQQNAIKTALKSSDLTLIQGPPGTGKTTIIIDLISRLLTRFQKTSQPSSKKKKRHQNTLDAHLDRSDAYIPPKRPILLSSYTNKALDNILVKLVAQFPQIRVVRLGKVQSVSDPTLLPYALEHICKYKGSMANDSAIPLIDPLKAKLILENAEVIASTTTTAGSTLLSNYHFDSVILDEAGQIVETSALIPLGKGDHFILVGDHMQLPPIDSTSHPLEVDIPPTLLKRLHFNPEDGFKTSIFERLIKEYETTPIYQMLSFQYRMNESISNFISNTFYNGKLTCGSIKGKSVGDQTIDDFFHQFSIKNLDYTNSVWNEVLNPHDPMVFIDTLKLNAQDSTELDDTKELESIFNFIEVQVVVKILLNLVNLTLNAKLTQSQVKSFFKKIGVISGYRAQNQKIRLEFSKQLSEKLIQEKKSTFHTDSERDQFQFSILEALVIDTVDRFQGQEREMILYSFVDSNSLNKLHALNLEKRRLNVAISRAKKKIIFLGHSQTLTTISPHTPPSDRPIKNIHEGLLKYIKTNGMYKIIEKL